MSRLMSHLTFSHLRCTVASFVLRCYCRETSGSFCHSGIRKNSTGVNCGICLPLDCWRGQVTLRGGRDELPVGQIFMGGSWCKIFIPFSPCPGLTQGPCFCTASLESFYMAKRLGVFLHKSLAVLLMHPHGCAPHETVGPSSLSLHSHCPLTRHLHLIFAPGSVFWGIWAKTVPYYNLCSMRVRIFIYCAHYLEYCLAHRTCSTYIISVYMV